ncbi:hypothetical protein [Anabaena sp. CCY 9910]|uniref:hypothetical protein n=1 Tax=Anabaena sp. CCY 9910 TaxID=3103870 RepID=UPI0039DF8899
MQRLYSTSRRVAQRRKELFLRLVSSDRSPNAMKVFISCAKSYRMFSYHKYSWSTYRNQEPF